MDNAVFLQADEKHESLVVDKISEKEERRQELEDEFTYDGYQVVRKELFAHLRDPAVTIRYDSITFNIVGKPSINEYNSVRTLQIIIEDVVVIDTNSDSEDEDW